MKESDFGSLLSSIPAMKHIASAKITRDVVKMQISYYTDIIWDVTNNFFIGVLTVHQH